MIDVPIMQSKIGTVKTINNTKPDFNGNVDISELLPKTHVVASEAEMLALPASQGDYAIRSDISMVFVLKNNTPSVLANWQQLSSYPDVGAWNGMTGIVEATTDDLPAGSNPARQYFANALARTALAAASNDCLLGATYAYIADASIVQGQINFAIDSPNGRLQAKFRLATNALVSYIIPAQGGNASFAALSATRLNVGTGLDASALVQLNSTTQGFLPPRMTTLQRTAISSPADGLIVWDTTDKNLFVAKDGAWLKVTIV